MARKRIIDPQFWSDETIGHWSMGARLLYIGLWNFADDKGRFRAHSDLLRAQIFPYDEKIDIEELKLELGGKIKWYEVDGQKYGFIHNFLKYQRIDRPSKSHTPPPPDEKETHSSKARQTLVEDSSPKSSQVNLIKDNISQVKDKCDTIFTLLTGLGLNTKEQVAIITAWHPALKWRGECYDCEKCRKAVEEIKVKVYNAKPKNFGAYFMKAMNNFMVGD